MMGNKISHYKILEELGRGGMGVAHQGGGYEAEAHCGA